MIQIKAVDAENIWDVCGLASRQNSPRGRGGAVCRWHTNKAPTGAAAETRDPRMRLLCRGKAAARVEA